MTLAERIQNLVDYSGLSVPKFAEKVGFKTPQAVRELIKGSTRSLSDAAQYKITSAFPELSIDWLLTGEGPMLVEPAEAVPQMNYSEGVPYYDEDFLLGFEELAAPSSENPDCLIRMPGYERATLWCNASGHSMEPEINNGDIIALQRIEDYSFLPFGDVYGIITTNGMRTIKRLGKSSVPGHYRLIPTNKDYDEQELPIDKIALVYRVMGTMKAF